MKKITIENRSLKFIPVAVMAVLIAGFAPLQTMANDKPGGEIIAVGNANSVQFAGSENNELLFNVKINNASGERFTLVVHNEEGEIVFLKGYTDKSFSKQIKLLKKEHANRYFFSIWRSGQGQENTSKVEVINTINF